MWLKLCFSILILLISGDECHSYKNLWNGQYIYNKSPQDVMVDVTNNLALKLLAIHNEHNNNNIAISPYGALSVLVALVGGLAGEGESEIKRATGIPQDPHIINVGLRDIHRHLKSYFIPKEGFLSGLTLSHDNVTLNRSYEDLLKYYGFDINLFNNALYPEFYTTQKPDTTTIATTISVNPESTEASVLKEMENNSSTTTESIVTSTESTITMTMSTIQETTKMVTEATTPPNTESTTNAPTSTLTTLIPMELSTIALETSQINGREDGTTSNSVGTTMQNNVETTERRETESTTDDVTSTIVQESTTSIQSTSTEAITSTLIPMELSTIVLTTSQINGKEDGTTTNSVGTTLPDNLETTERKETESTTAVQDSTTSIQSTTTEANTPREDIESTITTTEVVTTTIGSTTQIIEDGTTATITNLPIESSTVQMTSTDSTTENSVETSTAEVDDMLNSRKKRSALDYVIARYYDDHSITQRPPPPPEFTFLINGQYRESNISFMVYDTVLPFHYIPHLQTLALRFPLDSSKYYLLLLLPEFTDGIDDLICKLRLNTDLKYIINNLKYTHVKAVIPSFSLKGYVVLTPTFQKMGVRKVFEPRQADFSPMTDDKDIYVTNIEQAITVTIRNYVDPDAFNEHRYLQRIDPVLFKADHPFLYFVMDSEIHVALMAGKIVNPLNSRIR